MALKLRATRPPALRFERSPPGSFKRLLGRRRTYARPANPLTITSAAASAKSTTAASDLRTACKRYQSIGRPCGAGAGPDGRGGGGGGVPVPTAVGGRRTGGTSSAFSCVCPSNSSSLPESLLSIWSLLLLGCLFF